MLPEEALSARILELSTAQGAMALAISAIKDAEYERKRADRYAFIAMFVVILILGFSVWMVYHRLPPRCLPLA